VDSHKFQEPNAAHFVGNYAILCDSCHKEETRTGSNNYRLSRGAQE
jgi:hypothetical protein